MEESTNSVTGITFQDFQDNLDDYLKKAQSGHTFAITLDGVVMGYLCPPTLQMKEKYESAGFRKSKKKTRILDEDIPF